MAVDLADYVDVLRREVTPPGSTLFGTVSDLAMSGYLADAFWEARLDGFLEGWQADEDGVVTPVTTGGPELPRDLTALVILYAGLKILRNQLINTNTDFRAKAGPVEIETQSSAMLLTEMARQLNAVRERLLAIKLDFGETPTFLVDGLTVRNWMDNTYYGRHVSTLLMEALGTSEGLFGVSGLSV